jgi:hypothetical protein
MTGIFVPRIAPLSDVPLGEVVGEELSADFLFTSGKGYSVSIDPASDVIATHSIDGILLELAPGAAPASTVTTFAYDAVSKKLSVAVDGTTALAVDLAALDDEGTKLVINGQNLELQNNAGTVLSSTPIGQLDAQQLTGAAAAAGYKITLSNGGSVTITCADIGQMYASGVATATTELLSKDCKAVKVSELPIAHVNKWTKATGLTEKVNAVSSDIAIPLGTIVDDIGYDSSGNPVYQPIGLQPDFFSSVTATPDTLASPNNTTDRTEKIRRDGSIGLLVDPLTTFHNGGSYSVNAEVVVASAGSYVVTPLDTVVAFNASAQGTHEVVFPPAASFPERVLTVRMPVTMRNLQVTVKTAAGTEMAHPGYGVSGAGQYAQIVMDDRSVVEATWQSIGGSWRLINWTERAYYATKDYTAPTFGVTTFNNGGVAMPPTGVAYQVPPAATVFQTRDGNYVPIIKLPLTNNATGRFSVYCNSGLGTQIDWTGTDLPQNAPLAQYGESMHFEWSAGLWRWVYAPEANPTMDMYSYKNPNPLATPTITPNTNTPAGSGLIVSGTKAFQVVDGNYVPVVTLPPVDASAVPIVIQRNSAFPVTVAPNNTDMPTGLILGAGEAGRFVPSTQDNKWHWIPAEINPAAPSGAATVSPTGLLTMGGQTIQLVKPTSSLGTPLNYWVFPA